LAIGLRTDLDVAEAVKLQHASAMSPDKESPKTIDFTHGEEKHEFATKDIAMIVGARLDEIFELVDKELASIDRSGKLPGGVVVTGGGANLKGLADYAKHKLRLPVRSAQLHGFSGVTDRVTKPEFATVLGLMMADLETASRARQTDASPGNGSQAVGKLFKQATDLFRKFKP
jgi:cell division protein FtsA